MFSSLKPILSLESLSETPNEVARALDRFLNTSENVPNLPKNVQTWLLNEPEAREPYPITLYRGLFFADDPHSKKKTGEEFVGEHKVGDNFLLKPYKNRVSSWAKDVDVAIRYGLNSRMLTYKDAVNEFMEKNKPEENPFGIVFQATIKPKDIICDIANLVAHDIVKLNFGNEDECIVSPVKLETKILHIFRYDSMF